METKPANYKGRYQLKFRGTECLNCGHPLDMSDRFCPNCSQANSTKRLSLKDFIEEFLGSIVDYDSRLLKSVSALLLRPGRITLDYVAGKRVSYTNPFRFLLSLAIIYFLLISFSGDFSGLDRLDLDAQMDDIPEDAMNFELNLPRQQREALGGLDSVAEGDSLSLGKIFDEEARKDSLLLANPKAELEKIEGGFLGRIMEKTDAFFTLIRKDTLYSFEDTVTKYGIEESAENRISFRTARSLRRAMKQPGSFFNDLMAKLPIATFFFLPVFSVFVWLVYIRKNYTYTDNLVFSFHNQALFFILLIVNFLIDSIFKLETAWIFLLVFAVYLYKSMRNFYKQGRFKTIIKYLFLNTVFIILAWVAALMLLLGSAFTY